MSVSVEALRLEDGQRLVVIAPQQDEHLVADYALRWGIEPLFGLFKTRGFCLESTHFTEAERLRKRFALLTLALCWSMKPGLFLHQLKPIAIKNMAVERRVCFGWDLTIFDSFCSIPHHSLKMIFTTH